jgi:hypothetical protein
MIAGSGANIGGPCHARVEFVNAPYFDVPPGSTINLIDTGRDTMWNGFMGRVNRLWSAAGVRDVNRIDWIPFVYDRANSIV